MIKANFSDLKILSIKGENLNKDGELIKDFANFVFSNSKTLQEIKIAKDIYDCKEVDLSNQDLNRLKEFAEKAYQERSSFVGVYIRDFLDGLK